MKQKTILQLTLTQKTNTIKLTRMQSTSPNDSSTIKKEEITTSEKTLQYILTTNFTNYS